MATGWKFLNYRPAHLKKAPARKTGKPWQVLSHGPGSAFRPPIRPASIILGDLFNPSRGGPPKGADVSGNAPFELVGTFRCGNESWAVIKEKAPQNQNGNGSVPSWQRRYSPPGANKRPGTSNLPKEPQSKLYKLDDKLPHGYVLKKISGDHVVLRTPGGSSLRLKVTRGEPKPPSKGHKPVSSRAKKSVPAKPPVRSTFNRR